MPARTPSNVVALAESSVVHMNRDDPSIEELKRQREELDRRLAEKQRAEKELVIAQIVQVARDYDVSLEDLIIPMGGYKPKRQGTKAKIKYRDPETGTCWSGRGKEPTWLRGKDRSLFLVPDDY